MTAPVAKECRLCHRIGTRDFLPAGAEGWECGNDRACRTREARRGLDPATQPQRLRDLLPDVLDQIAELAAVRRVHPHPDQEDET